MNTTWTLNENSQGELVVKVDGDVWTSAQDKAFKKLAKNVEVKGFRKGQVPEAMAKKAISQQTILMEAIDAVSTDALRAGIEEHDLFLIARPELGIENIDEKQVTLTFKVTVRPEITLGEYKGLEITKEEVSVEDSEVEAQLTQLQGRFTELVVKEGAVENGDTAVIDFEGFKDGVAFEGGKGENYPLEIGSGSFIPGFEEQVIGMKTEESKDIEVTFPENYGAADLAGQAVVFKVTLHEVKTKELPEISDELIKDAEVEGVETVEAFKEYSKNNLMKQKEEEASRNYENTLVEKLIESTPIQIPTVLIDDEIDNMFNDFTGRLAQQGFPVDQYYQMTGTTEESLREQMREEATKKVHARLVLDKIAEVEAIKVEEADIEAEFDKIAKMYNMEVEQVKAAVNQDAVSYDLRLQKAIALVKENVK